MNRRLFAGLAGLAAFGQQANVNVDYNPQKNTESLVPFSSSLSSPDVRDDRTVVFRLKAPDAREVLLTGAVLTALGPQTKPLPFKKGDDGIWSLTIGPLQPDMYQYHLMVDGIRMADPNNTIAAFTAMPPYSQLVIHGDGPAYYDARNVPHGNVTRHIYHCRVADGVYETLVDGMELEEMRVSEGINVLHYLIVDDHYTWWECGRSYLCRILDMLHMGYVDEVLFGSETVERLPAIVKEWVRLLKECSS
jgi:hypothetical protein